jgi:RNA polymerase sigma-70 factor (ECF subfamily)
VSYLSRAALGDDQALGSLYDETNVMVYSLALRMLGNEQDAEEVTLDVYNQVWRIAKSFTADRGSVTAWLMTLARTRALDKLRARKSRQSHVEPIPEHFDPPADTTTPEQNTLLSEQRRMVILALEKLPDEQRRILEMAYFQGLSHSELADLLGEPLGTVKTRIRLGMMKLRDLLGSATARPQQGEMQ